MQARYDARETYKKSLMTTIDIMMTMTTNFFFVSFYWQLRSHIGANNGAKVGYTKNRMWPTWVIDPQIALKSK